MRQEESPKKTTPSEERLLSEKGLRELATALAQASQGRPVGAFEEAIELMIPSAKTWGLLDKPIAGSDTLLTLAANHLELGAIQRLLASGADPKAATQYGQSALMQTIDGQRRGAGSMKRAIECMEELWKSGADVHWKNQIGQQAIHWAATGVSVGGSQDGEMLAWALAKGADVSAKTEQGETPLHLAAQMQNEGMARMLLEAGADVKAQASLRGMEGQKKTAAQLGRLYAGGGASKTADLIEAWERAQQEKKVLSKATKAGSKKSGKKGSLKL